VTLAPPAADACDRAAACPAAAARSLPRVVSRQRLADDRPAAREREEAAMPQAWSDKDERQYEHIKDSAEDRGASTKRAKAIAARTVNKHRREEGRTKSGRKSTTGTGNPNRSLADRPKQELYNRAKQLGIEGRSSMSKDELVRAIRAH
jgi:hypothetical protein